MRDNILITGGSGYLGGTLLAQWKRSNVTGYGKLYTLVRSDEQAESVKNLYDVEPVKCSLQPDDIQRLLLENRINIVFSLIDAYKAPSQTVDVVIAFRAAGHAFRLGPEQQMWPVCHVEDCAALYISLITKILGGEHPGHGKNGYYLASSGSVSWDEIYKAIAASIMKHNLIGDVSVVPATDEMLKKAASALNVDTSSVGVKISGSSSYVPKHGELIGWRAKYPPEHIPEALDDEVTLILESLNDKHLGVR